MSFETAIERAPADAEHFYRGHAIAVHLPQHFEDVLALDLLEWRRAGRRFAAARIGGSHLRGAGARCAVGLRRALGTERALELALRQERPVRQHARALDD